MRGPTPSRVIILEGTGSTGETRQFSQDEQVGIRDRTSKASPNELDRSSTFRKGGRGRVIHRLGSELRRPPRSLRTTRFINSGSPFALAETHNVSVVQGSEAWIRCPAGMYPPAAVTWYKDGLQLTSDARHQLFSNNSLVISGAESEDEGRYECAAVMGGRRWTVLLSVLGPPKIGHFSFMNDQIEGLRSQLACMVISGDLPMSVTWLKDGQHLTHDTDRTVKQISEFSSVLVFQRLAEHHSGSYTCVVTNTAGSANQTATLNVKVSPRWVVEPRDVSGLVGGAALLRCEARGSPMPTITWRKAQGPDPVNFQPLPPRLWAPHPFLPVAGNGSLMLEALKREDAGWYLCRASNGVGSPLSRHVRLQLHAGATLVSGGGQVTAPTGQAVRLSCDATGDSPLRLAWSRQDVPLVSSNRVRVQESSLGPDSLSSVLHIAAVAPSDAGPYRCTAANTHATDGAIYTLLVIEPPSAPSAVTVIPTSSRSARVTWSLQQTAPVSLQYRATGPGSNDAPWHNVTAKAWATEHELTSLLPCTRYELRLLAHNELGTSRPSEMVAFETLEEAPTGAPLDVRASALEPSSLLVSWRPPEPSHSHGALRGYAIVLRQQSLQGSVITVTRPISTASGGGQEQYTVRGLRAAALYEVAVNAFNRAGAGPPSSPRIVRATLPSEPRCAPSGVSCRGSGPTSVRVSWDPPHPQCVAPNIPIMGYTLTLTPVRNTQGGRSETVEEFTSNLEKSVSGLPAAANLSVRVRAVNERGSGRPSIAIFCTTLDDVPAPPRRLRAVATSSSSLVVAWWTPQPTSGMLHYTLYWQQQGQARERALVAADGAGDTWRELTGLQNTVPIQVWVSATTSAGEGPPTSPLSLTPQPASQYAPLILTGGRLWEVTQGSGVTLPCRLLGSPAPELEWRKAGGAVRGSGGVGGRVGVAGTGELSQEQLLPGGDLHVSDVHSSTNYSCHARNPAGADEVTHSVHVTSQPAAPALAVTHATHSSLNISVITSDDGGAPILGHTVYYRLPSGSWEEVSVVPSSHSGLRLSSLPCGTSLHIYATSWNRYGTSAASSVLEAATSGHVPPRPSSDTLLELNETCVTLRLYTWPEHGCPVTGWKVEQQLDEDDARQWQVVGSPISRDTADLGLCDLTPGRRYLYRITAMSDAGSTTVLYRVALGNELNIDGAPTRSFVHEVSIASTDSAAPSPDAPLIAAVVSALLLSTALLICVGVAVARRRLLTCDTRRSPDQSEQETGSKTYASLRVMGGIKQEANTPIKRSKSKSAASLASQPSTGEAYEICPYATFGMEDQDTLQYGLSLHSQISGSECLDAAYGRLPPPPHARSQRPPAWKETDVSYGASSSGPPLLGHAGEQNAGSQHCTTVQDGREDSSSESYEPFASTLQQQQQQQQYRQRQQRCVQPQYQRQQQQYGQQQENTKQESQQLQPLRSQIRQQQRKPLSLPSTVTPDEAIVRL